MELFEESVQYIFFWVQSYEMPSGLIRLPNIVFIWVLLGALLDTEDIWDIGRICVKNNLLSA